jgi:hypothetical protein
MVPLWLFRAQHRRAVRRYNDLQFDLYYLVKLVEEGATLEAELLAAATAPLRKKIKGRRQTVSGRIRSHITECRKMYGR